jgi:radical SAM protein with 4Fe4S-binding SPASM domain
MLNKKRFDFFNIKIKGVKVLINKDKTKEIVNLYNNKYYQLRRMRELWLDDKEINEELLKLDSVLNIYVEPTNDCNLNCYYCARENSKREINYLSMNEFKNIIDPLPSGSYITLTGNGEPLLNKNIYDMIEYANNKGMIVSIITNGTVLTETNSKKLINSGVSRVQISFDSIEPKAYNKMKPNADLKNTLLKTLKFIYLARDMGSNIFISISTVMTEIVKEYSEISKKFWKQLPIDNYYEGPVLSLQTDSGAYNEESGPYDDKNKKFKEDWKVCADPWIVLKINSNGSVNSCPMDFESKYSIGNLKENDISKIINSKKALKLKRAHLNCDINFFKEIGYNCHKCSTWTSDIGYNLMNYIYDSFPIRLGLVIDEINTNNNTYDLSELNEEIKKLENDKLSY